MTYKNTLSNTGERVFAYRKQFREGEENPAGSGDLPEAYAQGRKGYIRLSSPFLHPDTSGGKVTESTLTRMSS